jgi:hypothetical protein
MAYMLNGSEHRWGERIRVDIPVRVSADGLDAAHGHLKNISLSGALVKSDHDLLLPAFIDVHIERPFESPCIVKARVSRKVAQGAGIEWCDFAPPIVKHLLRAPAAARLGAARLSP